jgi:DNA-binding transcriptional ArsR family regulator
MPRKLINPDELFSLLFNAPEGLTPSEIEFALGLTPNTVDYHLKKKAFSKQITGRYKLTSRDLDDFRTLGGYALPALGDNSVAKKDYPFDVLDWKTLMRETGARNLQEVIPHITAGMEKIVNVPDFTAPKCLSAMHLLMQAIQFYVDSVAFDKRYSDPEAREYILTTPLEK